VPEDLRFVSLKIAKYKCFGDEPQGFDHLPPFTLIIGRNNTGKSALLDLISYIVTGDLKIPLTLDGTRAMITISAPITEQDLTHVSGVPASELVGQQIRWSLEEDRTSRHHIDPNPPRLSPKNWSEIGPALLRYKQNPFRGYHFRRLNAERNIEPEEPGVAAISDHGAGTTRTIHHFLHSAARHQEALVEVDILRDLNAIFGADGTFTRIATREIEDNKVELYLDEATKGRIPLSRSGSGLKTVLLVLVLIHLIPALDRADANTYLYAFEELENNLHPALQRRLLRFLRATSEERHCRFFLTTHSPVDIDYFARDPSAQVLHVTHDRRNAIVTTVSDYLRGRSILDDLDVRASDILQANGIIWVEGPSDRLYLNRWIELWTDRALREGAHYQILQYGGSLLAHLDVEPPIGPRIRSTSSR
jgi:putative ATP-dependent endonuclease of OLD family